ncbi:MAG: LUD domain-containing protein [Gammaproteobacteria bacterium]|nr:LUD domain-containing protein [Gammaproteobacteria bacterium]
MSDSRTRILADIRSALNRAGPLPESIARTLESRLARPRANLQPAIGADRIAHFIDKLTSVSGKVTRVDRIEAVAEVVAAHLESHALGDRLVVAPDAALDGIPWSNRLSVERRAALEEDRLSVTGAYAAVAETGSVVLLSSPESPTTLNFLPDDHVVVVFESQIVAHIEDVWARMRKEKRAMPRTVNFITGPSKTGDVEQTIQEGAHGPRRLHVILVSG